MTTDNITIRAVLEKTVKALETCTYESSYEKHFDIDKVDAALTEARAALEQAQGEADESDAELLLRELASYLGVGGYNATAVDVKVFREKLYDGIRVYSTAHGIAARDLAETVLHMGMVTDRGLRARDLARKVLGAIDAAPVASPAAKDAGMVAVMQEAVDRLEGIKGGSVSETIAMMRKALSEIGGV